MGEEFEFVERLRAGDESAFAALVDLYHPRLVRFARTFVNTGQSAEDVAQETWVAVIRGAERFEGRSSLQTWLYSICANRARSRGVSDGRQVPAGRRLDDTGATAVGPFQASGAWARPVEPWADVDERLFAEAIAPLVRDTIAGLPDLQRQVVTLRDVDGLSSRETCQILGISEANHRVLLHRGRARLRAAVDAEMRGS